MNYGHYEIQTSLKSVGRSIAPQDPTNAAILIWESVLKTIWEQPPVWVHGDISPGNLLVQNVKLAAVIDFGGLAIGDPACDLAIAWTFFDADSRAIFQQAIKLY